MWHDNNLAKEYITRLDHTRIKHHKALVALGFCFDYEHNAWHNVQWHLDPLVSVETDKASCVMTMIRKVSDFVYFLPFLYSLYLHPEPSRTFYDDPHTTTMMNTPEHSSMT